MDEVITVYVDIACGAIESGEWAFDSAYSGLSDFARQLCEDHAKEIHSGGVVVKYEWDQRIASLIWQITKSVEWFRHINRFAKLSKAQPDILEQPRSYPPIVKAEPALEVQAPSKAEPIDRRAKRVKGQDLSRYLDAAKLTERQYQCASLRWEYGLSVSAIAREVSLSRKTIDQHLEAASAKMRSAGMYERMRKAFSKSRPEE